MVYEITCRSNNYMNILLNVINLWPVNHWLYNFVRAFYASKVGQPSNQVFKVFLCIYMDRKSYNQKEAWGSVCI